RVRPPALSAQLGGAHRGDQCPLPAAAPGRRPEAAAGDVAAGGAGCRRRRRPSGGRSAPGQRARADGAADRRPEPGAACGTVDPAPMAPGATLPCPGADPDLTGPPSAAVDQDPERYSYF